MDSAIWTEKYRPSTFQEIKGQKEIIEKIQAFVASKNLPHLLFSGPAGVGKTTLALVIAKQLFGEHWRENTLELNASDERGIDVVRVKVKDFARTKAIGEVPFKLIYLDESDALTKEAQQALRRTMENYTKTCRFILSCNYSSKIIDPIQSRCADVRSSEDLSGDGRPAMEPQLIPIGRGAWPDVVDADVAPGLDVRAPVGALGAVAAVHVDISPVAAFAGLQEQIAAADEAVTKDPRLAALRTQGDVQCFGGDRRVLAWHERFHRNEGGGGGRLGDLDGELADRLPRAILCP